MSIEGFKAKLTNFQEWQRVDRVAVSVMLGLTVLILVLMLGGDRSVARVRNFTWQDRQVGATDGAFTLTFNRPMDRASVENNLRLDPPLPGKISWAGRRMAYTLEQPAPYGFDFSVQLVGAQDQFAAAKKTDAEIEPFEGTFQSRDLAFVYVGVEEPEIGQLILYNFTQEEKTVLTPKDLVVMDFKVYPNSDRIIFSAIDRLDRDQDLLDVQLYTVTTGIHPYRPNEDKPRPQRPGKVRRILDNKDYQNLKFDLSPDGQTIIVQRANQKNPGGDFGLWAIRGGRKPQKLNSEPGGEFVIAPNSQELAIAQGQGIAVLSLVGENAREPLAFFPEYGRVLSFDREGSAAVMVKYNTDYTRSLYLVPNQGKHQELLRTKGSILQVQFDPTGRILYCLLTDLIVEGEEYQEKPYIGALDLESRQFQRLVDFESPQINFHMDVSPDGLSLLFDRPISDPASRPTNAPRTDSGEAIVSSGLWVLLPLVSNGEPPQLEELPLPGFLPRWLP